MRLVQVDLRIATDQGEAARLQVAGDQLGVVAGIGEAP
jgi:hypothetical protein